MSETLLEPEELPEPQILLEVERLAGQPASQLAVLQRSSEEPQKPLAEVPALELVR